MLEFVAFLSTVLVVCGLVMTILKSLMILSMMPLLLNMMHCNQTWIHSHHSSSNSNNIHIRRPQLDQREQGHRYCTDYNQGVLNIVLFFQRYSGLYSESILSVHILLIFSGMFFLYCRLGRRWREERVGILHRSIPGMKKAN